MSKYENFETFRVSNDKEQIEYLAKLLQDNGIEIFMDVSVTADGGIISGSAPIDYYLKISRADFEKANEVIKNSELNNGVDSYDESHPLFTFTKDELIEVIKLPYDWDASDYSLAIELLQKQGITYSADELQKYKDNQIAALSQPKSKSGIVFSGQFLILLGCIINIIAIVFLLKGDEITPLYIVSAGLTWLLSLVIGKSCAVEKLLPNGQKVPQYDEKCRMMGKFIIKMSFVVLSLTIIQIVLFALAPA